jgi:lactoylglutathione lyase
VTLSINLLVLRTAQLEPMLKFYTTLGLKFVEEQHGSGPVHYSTQVDNVVLEIYPGNDGVAPDRKNGGATLIGLTVVSLDTVLNELSELGVTSLSPPKTSAWGRRAVVLDPDGRAIELTEQQTIRSKLPNN